jgi:hypothetical protein
MTNQSTGEQIIYCTTVENVGFFNGSCGIKVDSVVGEFECILNRFERVAFLFCRTGFSCNSINGGYLFNTCYFSIPTTATGFPKGGTALICHTIGNIGNQPSTPNVAPTDGSTILKTVGEYNNINFYSCQDENVQFAYQNTQNSFDYVPLVYKNCLVQSKLLFTAPGSVVFDSCRVNVTGGPIVEDTSTAYARVYLKGLTNVFWQLSTPYPIQNFVNPYSQVIYESNEIGLPAYADSSTPAYYNVNATRGTVNIGTGVNSMVVYNNLINTNSLVFTYLRTYDPGGARIREVVSYNGYFIIYLSQNAATTLSIGFKVDI